MSTPISSLQAMRTSTSALVAGLETEQWTDVDVREPSLLPGWTRAHVLTHIARNADGINRTLSGALRGEVLARYPHGREGRDADIQAGATRPVAELLADVRESAERLDRVFTAIADADGWQLPTEDRSAGEYVTARWREVEVHRVDLRGGYVAAAWSPDFVSYLLPELVDGLSARTDSRLRVEIAAEGSMTPDLTGLHRIVGDGDPTASSDDRVEVVVGPDWAVLAWLIGRPQAGREALSAVPDIRPWI